MTITRRNILKWLGIHTGIVALLLIVYTIVWESENGKYTLCNISFKVEGYTTISKECKFSPNICQLGVLLGSAEIGSRSIDLKELNTGNLSTLNLTRSSSNPREILNHKSSELDSINGVIAAPNLNHKITQEYKNHTSIRVLINTWSESGLSLPEFIALMSKFYPIGTNLSVCIEPGTSEGIIRRFGYMESGERTKQYFIFTLLIIAIFNVLLCCLFILLNCLKKMDNRNREQDGIDVERGNSRERNLDSKLPIRNSTALLSQNSTALLSQDASYMRINSL